MLLTLGTHKIYKITSLTIDSYKQLFALITMLLTVLSVQQSNAAFAMAAPTTNSLLLSSSSPPLSPSPQAIVLAAAAAASVPVQQHNLLQHHSARLPSRMMPNNPRTRRHLQHPEAPQFNLLLDETNNNHNNNNNNNYNDNNHHRRRHHPRHYQHQSQTDIDTEERLLYKRQTSWDDLYARTMNSQDIAWSNPCGGHYVNTNDNSNNNKKLIKKRTPIKKILRALRNATNMEYLSLNAKQLTAIDIRNMSMWDQHNESYKFLPQIPTKSKITLRSWYKQLQYYVASFDYLHRVQLNWDYNKRNKPSNVLQELLALRNNARAILCDIEHSINNTTTNSKEKRPFDSLVIKREEMESYLTFATDIKTVSPLTWNKNKDPTNGNKLIDINQLDLKFAKSRYLTYVRKFIKLLRTIMKESKKPQRNKSQERQRQQKQRRNKKKPSSKTV
ncbi:uncharacterized protein [Musca autumnalis]|uniref:uncharacterized protein n=1 Tax=Musca autumnalis TaxID=221902 RepID=UPI003CE7E072